MHLHSCYGGRADSKLILTAGELGKREDQFSLGRTRSFTYQHLMRYWMRRRIRMKIIIKLKDDAPFLSFGAYRRFQDSIATSLVDYPFRTFAPLSS